MSSTHFCIGGGQVQASTPIPSATRTPRQQHPAHDSDFDVTAQPRHALLAPEPLEIPRRIGKLRMNDELFFQLPCICTRNKSSRRTYACTAQMLASPCSRVGLQYISTTITPGGTGNAAFAGPAGLSTMPVLPTSHHEHTYMVGGSTRPAPLPISSHSVVVKVPLFLSCSCIHSVSGSPIRVLTQPPLIWPC